VVGKESPVDQVQSVPIIVVLTATLVTAVTDLWRFKIYNIVTLPLLLSGMAYHFAVAGRGGLAASVLGAVFGFSALLIFYVMGGMGAGDVKLMAAIGAWLGLPLVFHVFIAASLAAGLYSVILLVAGKSVVETWTNFQILWIRLLILGRHLGTGQRIETAVQQRDRRLRVIPFAAMLMVGTVALLIWYRIHPVH
jgi:prepilin peptidase CpaA